MGPQRGRRLLLLVLVALAAAALPAAALGPPLTPVADAGTQPGPKRRPGRVGAGRVPSSVANSTRTCGAQDNITPEVKVASERKYHVSARAVARWRNAAEAHAAEAHAAAAREVHAHAAYGMCGHCMAPAAPTGWPSWPPCVVVS